MWEAGEVDAPRCRGWLCGFTPAPPSPTTTSRVRDNLLNIIRISRLRVSVPRSRDRTVLRRRVLRWHQPVTDPTDMQSATETQRRFLRTERTNQTPVAEPAVALAAEIDQSVFMVTDASRHTVRVGGRPNQNRCRLLVVELSVELRRRIIMFQHRERGTPGLRRFVAVHDPADRLVNRHLRPLFALFGDISRI